MNESNEINSIDYLPKPEVLDKHKHYAEDYKPGDLFWGIGIEREFYLESSKSRQVDREWMLRNQRPERYSVRYFNSYKSNKFNNALKNMLTEGEKIFLPVLFNAHAFYRCDASGQHETTYEKVPQPNPNFGGKVIFEQLLESDNPYFRTNFGKTFCFDGDAIEIMTRHYYCTTAQQCSAEMKYLCRSFLNNMNKILTEKQLLTEHLPLRWPVANYGFANMLTNPSNLAIFNNGTYHINLTAPTRLGPDGKIADRPDFVRRHQKIIRFFQWLEPFFIAIYGTGDLLASGNNNYGFARGSLRGAMSRYIGCGTYNSNTMKNGKCNTILATDTPVAADNDGWYNSFHRDSAYNTLGEIGLDINFNKHYNHGIELRFFDWFPEDRLEELLEICICSMDHALTSGEIEDCRTNRLWNQLMHRAISDGPRMKIWTSELRRLRSAIHIPELNGFSIQEIWTSLIRRLSKYKGQGECCRLMIEPKVGCRCF